MLALVLPHLIVLISVGGNALQVTRGKALLLNLQQNIRVNFVISSASYFLFLLTDTSSHVPMVETRSKCRGVARFKYDYWLLMVTKSEHLFTHLICTQKRFSTPQNE